VNFLKNGWKEPHTRHQLIRYVITTHNIKEVFHCPFFIFIQFASKSNQAVFSTRFFPKKS
jgi:hypothetical protein